MTAKAEANAQGTNRRLIVTNRPGAVLLFEAAYDEYVARGESENRNKEFECDLAMDRLSDHRFCANYFRLYLHAAAMNLLVRFRRLVALPVSRTPPSAAGTAAQRQRHFQQRRQQDPLGKGQPWTWRSQFLKVAAEVVVSSRRVLKTPGEEGASVYSFVETPEGIRRRLSEQEMANLDQLPRGSRVFSTGRARPTPTPMARRPWPWPSARSTAPSRPSRSRS